MKNLENKRAIITGGASGIGKATARLFAQDGASVAIIDRDEARGEQAAREIQEAGGQAVFIHCDVSSGEQARGAVEKVVEEFGGIDILFNNAGIIRRTNVVETTEEEWDRVMAVNLKSMFLFSKYCIPHMIASGGGTIVSTSSGWGITGGAKAASYCASKAAVVNLTRAMAIDHGKDNIRVNCICPGDVDTGMLRFEASQIGQPEEDFLKDAANRPLNRIGKPEEIARAVVYLASDESSYVTGHALVIDGGGTAG